MILFALRARGLPVLGWRKVPPVFALTDLRHGMKGAVRGVID